MTLKSKNIPKKTNMALNDLEKRVLSNKYSDFLICETLSKFFNSLVSNFVSLRERCVDF